MHGIGSADAEQAFFQASPDGDPTRLAVAFAAEESSQHGRRLQEFANGVDLMPPFSNGIQQPRLRDDPCAGPARAANFSCSSRTATTLSNPATRCPGGHVCSSFVNWCTPSVRRWLILFMLTERYRINTATIPNHPRKPSVGRCVGFGRRGGVRRGGFFSDVFSWQDRPATEMPAD